MKIEQSFTVARPIDEVWRFFHDIPAVAECMPGAELTADKGDGNYAGKVALKLGPFSAAFEGEAKVDFDEAAHSGHVAGKGVDKRGGSRSRMELDFRLAEVPQGTQVALDADIQLSGAIAQFGRTGIIQETSNILLRDFSAALEERLGAFAGPEPGAPPEDARPAAPAKPREIGGMSLILRALLAWIRGLFGKSG